MIVARILSLILCFLGLSSFCPTPSDTRLQGSPADAISWREESSSSSHHSSPPLSSLLLPPVSLGVPTLAGQDRPQNIAVEAPNKIENRENPRNREAHKNNHKKCTNSINFVFVVRVVFGCWFGLFIPLLCLTGPRYTPRVAPHPIIIVTPPTPPIVETRARPVPAPTPRAKLTALIGFEPLHEQVAAYIALLRVANNVTPKPALQFDLPIPTTQYLAPTQVNLYSRVVHRALSAFNLFVIGNAGCSKSTLYLALASDHPVVAVVPSNELAADISSRAQNLAIPITVVTQHAVFDLPAELLSTSILLVDEVYLLPEWHTRAIAALSPRAVAFGDPSQTVDLGFGQAFQRSIHPHPDEAVVELPTSFTVPQDVMDLAHSLDLIPTHYRSLSPVMTSMYAIRSLVRYDIPAITASRECKAGLNTGAITYTVVTAQGARIPRVVLHLCERDLAVLDPSATFSTGVNRKKLLWTMISRHSERAYMDLSVTVKRSFGLPEFPDFPDDADLRVVAEPDFDCRPSVLAPATGVYFSTFTPLTVARESLFRLRVSNSTFEHTFQSPMVLPEFDEFLLTDTAVLASPYRMTFDFVRL